MFARADTLVMDSLRRIFHEGDTDGSGELDMEERRCSAGASQ